jgi:glutathione S-transferase
VARFQVKYLGRDPAALDDNLFNRARGALARLEQALTDDFLVGGRLSLADVALVAYTRLAPEGGLDLSGLPRLRAWIGRVEQGLRIEL